MTPKEAAKIVDTVKPEMVVATHFGMKMLFSGPAYEIKLIEDTTGVPAIAAFDGMRLRVGEKIAAKRSRRNPKALEKFIKRN